MAYSELIKDIGKIRSFLRDCYVFGFYTRDEYAALYQISPRSYDNERRRIESWMGEYLRFYQNSSGKNVFLSVDAGSILHNPLHRVFKAKSFTANDALLHFCLMDLFSGHETLEQNQIEDLLWDEYSSIFADKGLPDMKTIRLKLEDLVWLGLLKKTKEKRSIRYRIVSEDIDLALPGLRDALSFLSETAPLGIIGSFLLDKKTADAADPALFRFRHHYLMQAIDSEILAELLAAIDEKRKILMRVDSAFQGSMQHEAVPLKIYKSTENGREYLLSWSDEMKRFYFSRLDRIIWLTQMEVYPGWDSVMDQFQSERDKIWGVSFGGLAKIHAPVHLEMELSVSADEAFIVRRLNREKRCGNVTKTDEGRYLFTADVYDANELLPWICTFTGRIRRLECEDAEVIRKYREYLTKMTAFYAPGGTPVPAGEKKVREEKSYLEYRPLIRETNHSSNHQGSQKSAKNRHDLIFHEVYGAYYNALARILSMAAGNELTPGKLHHIVQDNAFGESCLYLPDLLLSGEWPFLDENLQTPLKREPAMPLTVIQKRWLKALQKDPRLRLFLDDEAYRSLSRQLEAVLPLYDGDTFVYFDRFADGDPFPDPDYIGHFRTVLSALHQKKTLLVIYENQYGNSSEMRVIPQYLEYSGREDKFRLYAVQDFGAQWEEPLRLNISRIRNCRIGDEIKSPVPEAKVPKKNIVIELVDEENTLERAMFHFSFLEKKTERLDRGTFRITLYYAKADETEMVIRILSFGHQLNVISEGSVRDALTARLLAQNAAPAAEKAGQ